jgi:GT2 family glycosyltransferase
MLILRKVFAARQSSNGGSQAVSLQPQAVADVRRDDGTGKWLLTGPKPRLALIPEQEHHLHGWVLLSGKLHRRGADFTALLFTELAGRQWLEYHIPVSLKGTVLQLVYLERGVTRLEFQPMAGSGSFEMGDFGIQKINIAGLFARRLQRVHHIFATKPRERRQKIGLHWYTPLLSLRKSYELADRLRGHYPTPSYAQWLEEVDALTREDRRRIIKDVKAWRSRPRFWVLMFAGLADVDRLQATLKSLRAQLYFNVHVLVMVSSEDLAAMRAMTSVADWLTIQSFDGLRRESFIGASMAAADDWLMTLPPGSVLAEHALYWYASAALLDRECKCLYSDHDHLNADSRRVGPEFKPDWSPELLRSSNYLDSALAIRADLAATVSSIPTASAAIDFAQCVASVSLHDYLLRTTERLSPTEIQHIPAVLLHLPMPAGEGSAVDKERLLKPVADHLSRLGINAKVSLSAHGHCRVRYLLPTPAPKVSLIVPTRDGLHHLRACIESVLSSSTYRNFELLVVDNQSTEPETLRYLAALEEHPQIRVLHYPHPFNYSAINNFAVANAVGEALCLLNNDTEVITPDWLEEMLGNLIQPGVGVVGAKLYFDDGRVQHAGDTVGPGGCAHHLHSYLEHDAPGYCGRAVQAQELSAVTGACLLTWRKLYQDLGGLDEANLPVAFNDVDYCLRVREAQHRVVWTPYAELYHHESVSRGKDESAEKIARARRELHFMRKRWKHVLHHDPFYNPNLSYERPDFSLSHAPAVPKPWLR